jgi:hypothetical protein
LRPARDNAAEFLTRIKPFVDSDGARNLNPISRELSLPYQTLRFRMLHLKDQGITVMPFVDLDALGLDRFRVFFKISDRKLAENVRPFFDGLDQSAGLNYYSRSMLNNGFDCEFHPPRGSEKELAKLFSTLEEMNLVEQTEIHKFEQKDILMVKTQYFDFSRGEWDVDYSKLSGDPSSEMPRVTPPARFDYTDLLIVKELQIDPWAKVVDIAKKIKIPERDIAYHMNRHVFERRLISGFRFKWVGSQEAWSKHSIVMINFLFREISEENIRHAMSIFTASPFTWTHLQSSDRIYLAETLIPLSHLAEMMQYFSDRLRRVGLRPSETYFPDWNCYRGYTIPYKLYDTEKREWHFDAEKALEYSLQKVKSYSS